jgi:hypothetical protein
VIEASGENLGVDGTSIVNCIEAGGLERDDLAGDERAGQRRSGAAENYYAQIGPTAAGEIDREDGHSSEGTAARSR